jgi:hypothetical protein
MQSARKLAAAICSCWLVKTSEDGAEWQEVNYRENNWEPNDSFITPKFAVAD